MVIKTMDSKTLNKKLILARVHSAALIGIAVLLLASPVLLLPDIKLSFAQHDSAKSLSQSGRGTILRIVNFGATEPQPEALGTVTARLGNKEVVFDSYDPLYEGETVTIQYRVGKSGLIYVDKVSPSNVVARSK